MHDLGEIDGIKYITMPYIQGDDLATVLRRDGKLPIGARAAAGACRSPAASKPRTMPASSTAT